MVRGYGACWPGGQAQLAHVAMEHLATWLWDVIRRQQGCWGRPDVWRRVRFNSSVLPPETCKHTENSGAHDARWL